MAKVLAKNIYADRRMWDVVALPTSGLSGLADESDVSINWADIIRASTSGTAQIISAYRQPQYPYAAGYSPTGVSVGGGIGGTGAGLFGSVDTTTLLLIGMAFFLFMSKR